VSLGPQRTKKPPGMTRAALPLAQLTVIDYLRVYEWRACLDGLGGCPSTPAGVSSPLRIAARSCTTNAILALNPLAAFERLSCDGVGINGLAVARVVGHAENRHGHTLSRMMTHQRIALAISSADRCEDPLEPTFAIELHRIQCFAAQCPSEPGKAGLRGCAIRRAVGVDVERPRGALDHLLRDHHLLHPRGSADRRIPELSGINGPRLSRAAGDTLAEIARSYAIDISTISRFPG
jgi:hypothetical protein